MLTAKAAMEKHLAEAAAQQDKANKAANEIMQRKIQQQIEMQRKAMEAAAPKSP